VRRTPQVKAVIFTLHEIDRVKQRVLNRFQFSMSESGDWFADMRKLLESSAASEREDKRFVTGRSHTSLVRDRGPEQKPLHIPAETVVVSANGILSKAAVDESWQHLSSDFSKLANEEKSANAVPLSVMVSSDLDRSSDVADWKINEGYSEHFRARFELLASQAGNALGPLPIGASPFFYWLHRLYQHLREKRSKFSQRPFMGSYSGVEVETPLIDSACEASSIFCLRLQNAFEVHNGERALWDCFQDWVENNFVDVSIPERITQRNRVSLVAENANIPIPIAFLSSQLQEIRLPRGVAVGSPFLVDVRDLDSYVERNKRAMSL
jgi:hypothetical protein